MNTGKEGSLEFKASSAGVTVRLNWQETYDPVANISVITVEAAAKSSAWYGVTYWLDGSIVLQDQVLVQMRSGSGTHTYRAPALNTYAPFAASAGYTGSPWVSQPISHDADGNCTVTLQITVRGVTSGGNYGSGWKVDQQVVLELTPIARASTIGATDAFIGSTSVIAVSKKQEAAQHSIAYRFGELEGYLDAQGQHSDEPARFSATNIAFRIPESFYHQIPDRPADQCRLICSTWVDGVQLGQDQSCEFTVTANPAVCAPTLMPQVEDRNETAVQLTGDPQKLIRYLSAAHCAPNAAARCGAQLVQVTVNGTPVEQDLTLEQVESGSFVFTATDSRGYRTEVYVERELIPYVVPTCVATARRLDPVSGDVLLQLRGDCYCGSFGQTENVLLAVCSTYGAEPVSVALTISGSTYQGEMLLTGLDYRLSHALTVRVTDRAGGISTTVQVGQGIPLFDWGEEDVVFYVPISAPNLTELIARVEALENNS